MGGGRVYRAVTNNAPASGWRGALGEDDSEASLLSARGEETQRRRTRI